MVVPRTNGGSILRNRPLRAVAVAAVIAMSAAACTGSSNGGSGEPPAADASATTSASPSFEGATFTGHGVSFSYPKDWKEFTLSDSSASAGSVDWEKTVGLDGRNIVSVARYTLDVSITDANIAAETRSIGSEIESLFTQAGGSLTDGPTSEQLADLPALAFTGIVRTPNGRGVRTRLVLAFDGTTEYALNCQSDERARTEIASGCEQVASTLTVTG
jgi:hypothetical protein